MTTMATDPDLREDRASPLAGLHLNWDVLAVLALWIVLCIVFGTQSSSFWTTGNFLAIGSTGAVLGLLSLGQTGAILIGGFDLSVAGSAAIAGVAFVGMANHGFGGAAALIIAVVGVGGAVGLLNALAVNLFGINALIATLATMSICGGVADIVTNGLTAALNGVGAAFLNETTIGEIPVYLWVVVILFAVAAAFLIRTTVGRSLYVLGGNRKAALLAGLPVVALSIGVYVTCSMLSALGGTVAASQLTAADPTVDPSKTLLSITAVILGGGSLAGGEGGVGGTFAGVLMLATLSDGLSLTGVPSFYQDLITGVVLLLAVGASALRRRRRERI